ncbi:uncharacterized protein [Anas acuta]|uniref:uncharacterized protein isoform X4 n=1 Tax=Anas acuta TaxID=28680 RepID=UPI0035C8BE50
MACCQGRCPQVSAPAGSSPGTPSHTPHGAARASSRHHGPCPVSPGAQVQELASLGVTQPPALPARHRSVGCFPGALRTRTQPLQYQATCPRWTLCTKTSSEPRSSQCHATKPPLPPQGPGHAAVQDAQRMLAEQEEWRKSQLQMSGNLFIKQFLKLLTQKRLAEDIKKHYIEKVLHAVFFFGRLHKRMVNPVDFLGPTTCQIMQAKFPRPFEQYSTHLPSLTPYSILLQFGTEEAGCSTQEQMESFLRDFNETLQEELEQETNLKLSQFVFRAAVISFSIYRDPGDGAATPLFYGASLSCSGLLERKIMIAILCLQTWHKAVAFAVHHGENDLAIVFPDGVQSRAFYYMHGAFVEKEPCVKCRKMFKVDFRPPAGSATENSRWPYGNCAENESLSKLLQGVPGLQERVVSTHTPPQPNTYQAIEQEFADVIENSFRRHLVQLLQERHFFSHLPLQFF